MITNIAAKRKLKKISMEVMAKHLGISPQEYAELEKNEDIKIQYAWKIADILNLSLDDLVGRTFKKNIIVELSADIDSLMQVGMSHNGIKLTRDEIEQMVLFVKELKRMKAEEVENPV